MRGLADLSAWLPLLGARSQPLIRRPSAATFSRKGRRIAGVALLLGFLLPALAWAAPKFPPLSGRVIDQAEILSPATEQRLTGQLAALEEKTGHQLVVATLRDLQGYEIEDYGYQLGRAWALGRKGQNDGAILIIAPNQRAVRIEVGYGLEPVLTDAMSSLILQRAILPAFKAGDLEKGVVDGTEAIVAQIGLPPEEARARAAEAQAQRASAADGGGGGGLPWQVIVGIFIVLWVLGGVTRAFGGRRRFGGNGLWWILPLILSNSGRGSGGHWSGGGGGGGFSGGGGSFGGGGASGRW